MSTSRRWSCAHRSPPARVTRRERLCGAGAPAMLPARAVLSARAQRGGGRASPSRGSRRGNTAAARPANPPPAAPPWPVRVAGHCGPLQNTTVGWIGSSSSDALGDLTVRDVDRTRNRAALDVLGEPAVDERPPGAEVLDHLELPDGADAGSEADRLDHAPGRVNGEDPRLALDRLAGRARDGRVVKAEGVPAIVAPP